MKNFKNYLLGGLGAVIVVGGIITVREYAEVRYLQGQLDAINETIELFEEAATEVAEKYRIEMEEAE